MKSILTASCVQDKTKRIFLGGFRSYLIPLLVRTIYISSQLICHSHFGLRIHEPCQSCGGFRNFLVFLIPGVRFTILTMEFMVIEEEKTEYKKVSTYLTFGF